MDVSLFYCIPFVGMLLSIAIFPLVKPHWWEEHQGPVSAFWSLCFLIPFTVHYGIAHSAEITLECIVGDYIPFLVLLFGLFCVAGNIFMDQQFVGNPKSNVAMLFVGTMLSSFIGTTGASMIFIRPIIKMNAWRKTKVHIIVFFIFLVSNIGGCLTPIGDPPLLMGFARGVPFAWSFSLFPIMMLNVILLLIIFFFIDNRAMKKDMEAGLVPPQKNTDSKFNINGKHNIIFLAIIVFAVILSGVLPTLPMFQNEEGGALGIHIYGEVQLGYNTLIEIVMILIAAFLSMKTTKVKVREENHFTWAPIKEVAYLFIGIFITMQPALMLLKLHGGSLGISEPYEMFWVTGILSSFLDNTPTYLVFLTTGGALGFSEGILTTVGMISVPVLTAVSVGAVFMGANTYIGNAPNFMVKAIADENEIKMPSFFGYITWSIRFLIPIFIIDTLVFFFPF